MTTISEGPRSVADAIADLDIRAQAFVDGAYVDAISGETFDCVSPISGEVVMRGAETLRTSTAPSPPVPKPRSSPAPGRASRRRSASACCRSSPR